MRYLFLAALLLTSCALTRTVSERDVSVAIGHPVSVQYTRAETGWERTREGGAIVRIDDRWKWEPAIYHMGAIAGLACQATDSDPDKVADALDIPRFAMWDGDAKSSKIEATRQQARLERVLPHTYTFQDTAPGWPTYVWR